MQYDTIQPNIRVLINIMNSFPSESSFTVELDRLMAQLEQNMRATVIKNLEEDVFAYWKKLFVEKEDLELTSLKVNKSLESLAAVDSKEYANALVTLKEIFHLTS